MSNRSGLPMEDIMVAGTDWSGVVCEMPPPHYRYTLIYQMPRVTEKILEQEFRDLETLEQFMDELEVATDAGEGIDLN